MGFATIGLMLGYRCNATCRSCLWGEQIYRKTRMGVEDACAWVDQAHALGDLRLVGFSGGEPFIYRKDMTEIMRYVHETYELPSVAVTNSFWAATPEKTRAILKPLYDLGLRQLLLSVDDFHQEYVPLERVDNCLKVAKELGIAPTVQCVVTESSKKLDDYLDALDIKDDEDVTSSEIPCTPIGFAASELPASEFKIRPGVPSDYCSMLQTLIVLPEGTVHLCCGPTFSDDGLVAGNLHQESLASIVERAEWDPLYNALALGNGPGCYVEKALAETGQDGFLLDGYASSCHACHHILDQPGMAETLSQALEPQRAEMFFKRTILDQEIGHRNADILKF